ncbi:uncharacterized protein LOC143623929 [Bidens hawaiensis]|uniref:uncharacterized protein LOC143623929 n=1 Tax=Bidens hawaiensis TaxID=980011 RepID=UPI00404B77E0
MAAPHATAQVPTIQAPPTNQATPTPQGSNGHAFMMNVNKAQSSSDVVNGMYSINNHSASVLFDTGADKSFISLDFAYTIDKPWDRLAVLNKAKFCIDLILMKMDSFDVIAGMDWLTLNHVEVVCFEKFLRIPFKDGHVLKVFGSTPAFKLNLMSCFQAQRYLRKKYDAFLALVVEKDKDKNKIQDIPIVRDFPDVFPDDVVRLPPIRQVEFHIDLVPGANPVAKALYRLAPSKMQELSSQLQELSDKGYYRRFIRNLSKIVLPLTALTHKGKPYEWGSKQEEAFQTLKDMLYNAPILVLPEEERILNAQHESVTEGNMYDKMSCGVESQLETKPNGWSFYFSFLEVSPISFGYHLDLSTAYHPQSDGQSERTIQTLEDMLHSCDIDFVGNRDIHLPLIEFSYNNSFHLSKPSMAANVILLFVGMKLENLNISVERCSEIWKEGKLSSCFIGPFEILDRVGPVAYRLKLPSELSNVHPVFHVSNLKKCLAEGIFQIPLDEVRIDETMHFVERPVEIMNHKDKGTKRSRVPLVKVRWESKQGAEFTWERENQMKEKYLHLFATVIL